jgi:hypothetical protein
MLYAEKNVILTIGIMLEIIFTRHQLKPKPSPFFLRNTAKRFYVAVRWLQKFKKLFNNFFLDLY